MPTRSARVERSGGVPDVPTPRHIAPRPAAVREFRVVLPFRDPFADPRSDAADGRNFDPAVAAHLPTVPPAIRTLPPNAGAPAFPFAGGDVAGATAAAPVVEAIVTGTHPAALVADGGGTRVVMPGAALAGSRVVLIDADGVHLAGGSLIPLAPPRKGDR